MEWTLYFKNNSTAPSEVIDNLRPLDTEFERGSEAEISVHHSKGSMAQATDFQPLVDGLATGGKQQFASKGGRPSDGDMPYFNLAWLHRGIISCSGLAWAVGSNDFARTSAKRPFNRRSEFDSLSADARRGSANSDDCHSVLGG